MALVASILDPRADPEPADWRAFVARQQLHPVWDYGLMRLESWMARNPPVLAIVRGGTRWWPRCR